MATLVDRLAGLAHLFASISQSSAQTVQCPQPSPPSATRFAYGQPTTLSSSSSSSSSSTLSTSSPSSTTTTTNSTPLTRSRSSSASSASSASFAFREFDVDPQTGFFPPTDNGGLLSGPFALWEQALSKAAIELSLGEDDSPAAIAKRASSAAWRAQFQSMQVLDTAELEADARLCRRAHHVLAFLVHFYVHSIPPATIAASATPLEILIPKALAIPLVSVSRKLGIAPVLTFADSVLWNFELVDPARPLERGNIRPLTLFTAGADESNFYGCCAEIELRGVEALRAIAAFYDIIRSPNPTNTTTLSEQQLAASAKCLDDVAFVIDDLTSILQSVKKMCDPHAFYFAVRPWFRGSDAGGPDAPQWVFEGVKFADGELELSGPSAGQSSIIHTLDAWLEVEHNSFSVPSPSPSSSSTGTMGGQCPMMGKAAADGSSGQCPMMAARKNQAAAEARPTIESTINGAFMERMRKYMPGSHQSFLEELDSRASSSIRQFAITYPQQLLQPYNRAVMALKKFRDIHIQIACLYIVNMSRSKGVKDVGYVGMNSTEARKPVRGTGGNELSSLLKSCRNATTATLLPVSA